MGRGIFIALEGIDGSGSSTQTQQLGRYLESIGQTVHVTAEPSHGPMGKVIRTFLQEKGQHAQFLPHILALAFASDRLHHYEQEIRPFLEKGVAVLSDRYVLSSLVYQGLELPDEWVASLNRYAPQPDLTVLIDVPEEIAKERRQRRGGVEEIFDKSKVQIQVRDRYLKSAKEMGAIIVDGSGDVSSVQNHVIATIKYKIPSWKPK